MNHKIIYLLILLTASCKLSLAQQPQFSGYFENQLFPQRLNNEWLLQDYNKLRLDLGADIGKNASFHADYIYKTNHGATSFNAFDFMPASVVQQYLHNIGIPKDKVQPYFQIEFPDENYLDNAYFTFYSQHANIRIGKQQLPWGTGYTWNPTDIFHEKNVLDPLYEKVGVNAFKVEIPYSDMGMVTTVFAVGENFDASTKAIKCKYYVLGFDVSASFIEKNQESFNPFSFQQIAERRRLFGGDFSGELLGLGIWGEGAYNTMERSGNFGQYLLGLNYTFPSGMFLTAEYYHNGLGKTDKNQYSFQDWLRLISSQGENLGRHYLFAGESYPITDLWNWSNYLIINFNDKSGILFPWLDTSLNDNTELILVGYVPFGSDKTEFGEFGTGGLVRLRVYF